MSNGKDLFMKWEFGSTSSTSKQRNGSHPTDTCKISCLASSNSVLRPVFLERTTCSIGRKDSNLLVGMAASYPWQHFRSLSLSSRVCLFCLDAFTHLSFLVRFSRSSYFYLCFSALPISTSQPARQTDRQPCLTFGPHRQPRGRHASS